MCSSSTDVGARAVSHRSWHVDQHGVGQRGPVARLGLGHNTRTTYQFSRALAARAIAQYDRQRERVLTDLLGSYEPRPGTVVFAGHGSLYEQRTWDADQWVRGTGRYLTTRRGLFFKASYLYRF